MVQELGIVPLGGATTEGADRRPARASSRLAGIDKAVGGCLPLSGIGTGLERSYTFSEGEWF